MSKKVFYYSRSGNCARVAQEYTKNGEGHSIQIMDLPEDRYWGGLGYIKAIFDIFFKSKLSYRLVGESSKKSTEVILVIPVWAGQVPPTFRTFLTKESFDPEVKVTIVTVSNSGNGRATFQQVVGYLEKVGVHEIRHRNLKTSDIQTSPR